MQAVAEQLGLDAETAQRLTQQTALGAARMAIESDDDVAGCGVKSLHLMARPKRQFNRLKTAS